MIRSFSGQVVFCFVILRAISAYVGENWLSQYSMRLGHRNPMYFLKVYTVY